MKADHAVEDGGEAGNVAGGVTFEWLKQAEDASLQISPARPSTTGSHEGPSFSVIEEFNYWRTQPDLAEAVAAIKALTAVIRRSQASTMMGLEIELKNASEVLKAKREVTEETAEDGKGRETGKEGWACARWENRVGMCVPRRKLRGVFPERGFSLLCDEVARPRLLYMSSLARLFRPICVFASAACSSPLVGFCTRIVGFKVSTITMAVHFMFAAVKDFDSVPVTGDGIPLGQLKDEIYNLKFRAALEKRRIKEAFDFRVFDAETKEEILGAHTRVPKHSRVLVKRVPAFAVPQPEKQQLATQSYRTQEISKISNPREIVIDDDFGDDVYSTPSVSVSCVSSDRYSSGNSVTSNLTATKSSKEVPKIGGVLANKKIVRPKVVQDRKVVRVGKNLNANLERVAKPSPESAEVLFKVKIPQELACSLCNDIMKDPVLIPCCCNSFCRSCVTVAILEQQKCPKCGSSKCRDSDLLPNRHVNNMVHGFLKSNGIASNVVTVSSNGSNGSRSSQSLASSISSEHAEMSESKKASDHKPSVASSIANSLSNSLSDSQIMAPGSTNVCEKRKMAPLCISLNGAKKAKPLSISLTGAKEEKVASCD